MMIDLINLNYNDHILIVLSGDESVVFIRNDTINCIVMKFFYYILTLFFCVKCKYDYFSAIKPTNISNTVIMSMN